MLLPGVPLILRTVDPLHKPRGIPTESPEIATGHHALIYATYTHRGTFLGRGNQDPWLHFGP